MAQIVHSLEVGPLDLVGSGSAHIGRRGPIELTSQEIDWTLLDIDLAGPVTSVKAPEVKI